MATKSATAVAVPEAAAAEAPGDDTAGSDAGYVVPVVHVRLPEKLVNVSFWGGLTGAVMLGAIDPPLGVLVGAGVVVARHQMKR